ncbi:MAG: malate dehydrogenase [Anaerolineae bacterium]|nr:malate dehydrogenase [Anaerolineae bacterium]
MARNKITIIGAGNVGASAALWLAPMNLGDIVLKDIPQTGTMPAGKALDLAQAGPIMGYDSRILGTTDYGPTEGSDVIVFTGGFPRKPGMSREDLVAKNEEVVVDVMNEIKRSSPNAIVIMVTNPLDTMAYVAYKMSGFPRSRILGQAGILDSARYRAFIAQELNVSVASVQAFTIGGHGDEMVPLARSTTVGGVALTKLLPKERIDAIVERTRKGGGEIVQLLGTSAYYAPGAACAQMVEAILNDRKLIVPVAAYLDGEYGLKDMYFGVMAKLGRGGVEEIIEAELDAEERTALNKSVELIRGTMSALKQVRPA